MNHNRVNVKADIRRDRKTGDVYVIDGSGKEIFRRPYNPQIVELANSIYMSAKYGEDAFPSAD